MTLENETWYVYEKNDRGHFIRREATELEIRVHMMRRSKSDAEEWWSGDYS
jgi:hypothetical protein